jgi:class 3 adenylate cyclase
MRNILLRHFLLTYCLYMFAWIITVTFLSSDFEYQIL